MLQLIGSIIGTEDNFSIVGYTVYDYSCNTTLYLTPDILISEYRKGHARNFEILDNGAVRVLDGNLSDLMVFNIMSESITSKIVILNCIIYREEVLCYRIWFRGGVETYSPIEAIQLIKEYGATNGIYENSNIQKIKKGFKVCIYDYNNPDPEITDNIKEYRPDLVPSWSIDVPYRG